MAKSSEKTLYRVTVDEYWSDGVNVSWVVGYATTLNRAHRMFNNCADGMQYFDPSLEGISTTHHKGFLQYLLKENPSGTLADCLEDLLENYLESLTTKMNKEELV